MLAGCCSRESEGRYRCSRVHRLRCAPVGTLTRARAPEQVYFRQKTGGICRLREGLLYYTRMAGGIVVRWSLGAAAAFHEFLGAGFG